ncbi:hypothetical protein D030_0838B, partial [Vibrio parahaemolyticus AQ3810]
QRLYRSK